MAELAQPGALHVAFDFVRDRTAERNQTIAKEFTERMVDVFGQAGAEKTESGRVTGERFSAVFAKWPSLSRGEPREGEPRQTNNRVDAGQRIPAAIA